MLPTVATPAQPKPIDTARVQRRTVTLLMGTQIMGGIGVATGIAVGALLVAGLAGTGASGLAGSTAVIGAAVLAIPATKLMRRGGRRPGLVFAYLAGGLGALLVVAGAALSSVALVFFGTFLFGGGSTANLQARYTAVDLAEPSRRGRQLSLVVWATTVGAVTGPNIAPLTDRVTRTWGVPELAGPFLFSAVAFGCAALTLFVTLRPDPLLTARAIAPAPPVEGSRGIWRRAIGVVRANPNARLGIAAVAVGHLVMVGVMSMTPVHIGGYIHEHGDLLRIVGIVLSLHIAGMYALSPVFGWLTDRVGRRPVIGVGMVLLLCACAVAGTAGDNSPRLSVGLTLLGLGWSATMVAGSTLLSESVTVDERPGVQGLSDVVMGCAGAFSGAMSGLVVEFFGYPTLAVLAAVSITPLAALAVRRPVVVQS
jgi:MFS family permease